MQRGLVQQAMAGDREAFSELMRLSIAELYAIARLILRDSERAEDAVQQSLIRRLSASRSSNPAVNSSQLTSMPTVTGTGAGSA